MSRFADPTATRTVDLGECQCPGTPHPSDQATIKGEASAGEVLAFIRAAADDALARAATPFIVEWNLLDDDGRDWPPTIESVGALKTYTIAPIIAAINEMVEESGTVPNASGAPSAASSRGSASRTRTATAKPGT